MSIDFDLNMKKIDKKQGLITGKLACLICKNSTAIQEPI
jgi:hypothetical protein